MKTLYLHIGTPKTATTYLQNFLRKNRKALEIHDFCFPKSLTRYDNTNPGRNAHFLIGTLYDEKGVRDLEAEKRAYSDGMEQLHSCLERFDGVILSDESLWRAFVYTNKTVFQKLMADARECGYQIKIIVYLRRQDQFLLSRWNQTIKSSVAKSMTLEEYQKTLFIRDEFIYDYAYMLDQLAKDLGKENLIVRRFEPSDWKDGSITTDFLNCLGLSMTPDFTLPEKELNTSLKGNTCEIRRLINKNQTLSPEDRSYFGSILRQLSEDAGERYPCSMMSVEETKDFLQRYEEGNARVAKEYLADGKPLFSSEIKNLPKWEPENPHMQEDMLHFFSAVAADLHQTSAALQGKNEELQRENEELRGGLRKLENNMESLKDKLKHPARTLAKKLSKK